MNATMLKTRNNDSDKRFRNFVEVNSLHTSIETLDEPTYIHGNGKSQIDYCFVSDSNTVSKTEIFDPNCINSSSHMPIKFTIKSTLDYVKLRNAKQGSHRLLWDKADRVTYQENTSLNPAILESPDQIKTYVDYIHNNILCAAKSSVPAKNVRLQGPKWKASPETLQLIVKGKQLHKEWLTVGKPGPEHPLSIQRKTIKRNIRSSQRKQIYDERNRFL